MIDHTSPATHVSEFLTEKHYSRLSDSREAKRLQTTHIGEVLTTALAHDDGEISQDIVTNTKRAKPSWMDQIEQFAGLSASGESGLVKRLASGVLIVRRRGLLGLAYGSADFIGAMDGEPGSSALTFTSGAGSCCWDAVPTWVLGQPRNA